MKEYKRRNFLLLFGQISFGMIIVPGSSCSDHNHRKPKNRILQKNEKVMIDLKNETLKLLNSGKEIKLKWDCGGDEAIVTTFIDGKQASYENQFVQQLELYLIYYLNLPDIGEFELEGAGKIIQTDGNIFIEYESIMKGFVDYGERGEKEEWVKVNQREEDWSGNRQLFKDK